MNSLINISYFSGRPSLLVFHCLPGLIIEWAADITVSEDIERWMGTKVKWVTQNRSSDGWRDTQRQTQRAERGRNAMQRILCVWRGGLTAVLARLLSGPFSDKVSQRMWNDSDTVTAEKVREETNTTAEKQLNELWLSDYYNPFIW